MIESLFSVLSAGLSIWENKEKTKYVDKLIKLKTDYYAEYNKDPIYRDDSVLDNIEFELRILASAFAASAGKPDVKN